ncbi:MAG: flagellar basal-body protein FlbY [Maricaulaceae bacterium]|nr:flagellar basal-body protein FlbY [Maricaulaceae bacterium]
MTRLTTRLTSLVEAETALFKARRPHEAAAFQDEKSRLATVYRRETAAIKADPRLLDGAGAAAREALAAATRAFHAALAANGAAVETMRTLTEGIVRAVADAAESQRASLSGYGPGAGARNPAGAPAIAVNRTA